MLSWKYIIGNFLIWKIKNLRALFIACRCFITRLASIISASESGICSLFIYLCDCWWKCGLLFVRSLSRVMFLFCCLSGANPCLSECWLLKVCSGLFVFLTFLLSFFNGVYMWFISLCLLTHTLSLTWMLLPCEAVIQIEILKEQELPIIPSFCQNKALLHYCNITKQSTEIVEHNIWRKQS